MGTRDRGVSDRDLDRMSLKAFWQAVEERLTAHSADELRAILRAMAQATPPTQRAAFLDQLKPAKGMSASLQKKLRQDELLNDIDDLIQDIQEATDGAGVWEDDSDPSGGDYGGGYYNDEDSLGPYDVFVEPMAGLFDRVQAVFKHGNVALARQAYQKLFEEALHLEDEYGRGVRPEDLAGVDVGECRARYLRAVYETESPKTRPRKLLEQMQQSRAWISEPRPRLTDLIEISTAPLPDQAEFLAAWIALLRREKGAEADAWLREAILLAEGTAGLAALARAEGKQRPRVYLDWFQALGAEGNDQAVLTEAQTALKTVPAKLPIRAAIADYLCAAAARLGDAEALRAGRWEALDAAPTLPRLLDLWDVMPEGKARTKQLRRAAQHVAAYLARRPRSDLAFEPWGEDRLETPAWIDKSVLVHAYVLAGDLASIHALATKEKVLGWSDSDNSQGLVVPLFLVLLSGKPLNALPANLKRVWHDALEISLGRADWREPEATERNTGKRLEHLYAGHITQLVLSQNQQTQFMAWCLRMAKRRAEAIVGEQHRRSYDKAAQLLAACAELLRLRGETEAARAFVNQMRERFPRHRAFQAELDAATGRAQRSR
jgi:hypothetical protein